VRADGRIKDALDAYDQALRSTPDGKRYLLGLVLSVSAMQVLAADLREMDHPGRHPASQNPCELCALVALLSSSTGEGESNG